MRSSVVPLAAYAGALVALTALLGPAPARAAGGGDPGRVETPRTNVFDESKSEAREPSPPEPGPLPTPLEIRADELAVGRTYEDVFRVLREDNACSRFFGGPRVAVTVLNEFARRLRRRMLGSEAVALAMRGGYTRHHDSRTGASYRLFDDAAININGPFVVVPPPSGARYRVGKFPATSRPAKALMLLHEMGHLIWGPGGWLLPNDGGDPALSDRNTRAVESRCIEQVRSLRE